MYDGHVGEGPIAEVGCWVTTTGEEAIKRLSMLTTVCEQGDGKGLDAKARAVIIKELTGIFDPHEEPLNADHGIDLEEGLERTISWWEASEGA